MSPKSVQKAGFLVGGRTDLPRLGFPGHLAVCPAQAGQDGAHTDAGGSAQVPTALCVQTG